MVIVYWCFETARVVEFNYYIHAQESVALLDSEVNIRLLQ